MKKLIAIILAAVLCVSLLPVMAMAAGETVIADGNYLISAGGFYATALDASKSYDYLPATAVAGVDTANPAGELVFTIKNVDGGITIQDSNGKYLGLNSTYNTFNVSTTLGKYSDVWTITKSGEGFVIVNNDKNKTFANGGGYDTFGAYPDVTGKNSVLTLTKVEQPVHTHDYKDTGKAASKLDHFKHVTKETKCACGEIKLETANHKYTDGVCSVCSYKPTVEGEATISQALTIAKNTWDAAAEGATEAYSEKMYTITGKVTEIKDAKYGNLYISDDDGNKLYVYGLYLPYGGDRFDAMATKPAVGDVIVIQTVLGAYNGAVQAKNAWLTEIKAPVTNDDDSGNEDEATKPTTEKEIVDAAYALEAGKALEGEYTLTGKIASIDTEYSEQYKNITVTIKVSGCEDKPIQCFRLKGDGAADLAVGDTITVTGKLLNYNGKVQFDAGCKLDKVVKNNVPPTGDNAMAAPVAILMVLSITGLAVITVGKKKFF